jgi:hypothetical protein
MGGEEEEGSHRRWEKCHHCHSSVRRGARLLSADLSKKKRIHQSNSRVRGGKEGRGGGRRGSATPTPGESHRRCSQGESCYHRDPSQESESECFPAAMGVARFPRVLAWIESGPSNYTMAWIAPGSQSIPAFPNEAILGINCRRDTDG